MSSILSIFFNVPSKIQISSKRTGFKTELYNHTPYKTKILLQQKYSMFNDHVCQPRDLSTCYKKTFKICNAKLNVTQRTKIIRDSWLIYSTLEQMSLKSQLYLPNFVRLSGGVSPKYCCVVLTWLPLSL